MILLIDNYDSFVHNLARYVREMGLEATVVRNDQLTIADVVTLRPEAIILSPGPCTPAEAGICVPLIRQLRGQFPILGVCLGHQAIA
jgi:anthranilate synthase component II